MTQAVYFGGLVRMYKPNKAKLYSAAKNLLKLSAQLRAYFATTSWGIKYFMKTLFGVILIIVSLILGMLAALHLLAFVEDLMSGDITIIYIVKRIAIAFILGFFSYQSFIAGKNKYSTNIGHISKDI